MNWFRRSFMTLGIIFLIIGLMPNWRRVTTNDLAGAKTKTRNVFTLGVPPSPLFLVEVSHTEQVRGQERVSGSQRSFKLEFVSWSMLSLVLGALFFVADRWWRRSSKSISLTETKAGGDDTKPVLRRRRLLVRALKVVIALVVAWLLLAYLILPASGGTTGTIPPSKTPPKLPGRLRVYLATRSTLV